MPRKRTKTSADQIAAMDREALTRAILSLHCDFPLDLTEELLQSLNLEKLRHVYVALLAHAKRPAKPH